MPLEFESLEYRLLFSWSSYAKLIGQDAASTDFPNINGKGVTVAMIDTGIDYKLAALGGGFGAGFKVVAGYDFVDNKSDPIDTDGHGTDTAFTVAGNPITVNGVTYQGVAPDAHLVALKAGTENGGFTDQNIASALEWVINNYKKYGISIVNMSIGSGSYTSATTQSPESEDLAKLHDLGIMVIAASGNSNDSNFNPISQDGIAFPAADPTVFAVGAVDSTDALTTWGQRGSELDLLAPGVQIVMPDITSSSGATTAEDGTSFASPLTAGTAALLKQADPSLAPGDIGSILMTSGKDLRDDSQDTGLLFSRLSIDNALKLEQQRVGKTTTLSLGSSFSTALDAEGVLHAAFYDTKHHDLLYATRDLEGLWSKPVVVDSSKDVAEQSSIAVDSTGKVGIAYYDAANTALKYASYNGITWSTRTVTNSGLDGQNPSMAFSIYGNAYIGYYRKSGGGMLKLATLNRDANTFSITTVDGGSGVANTGADLSLDVNEAAVSSSGFFTTYDTTVAIAYTDSTNHTLKYSRLDVVDPTATWYTAVVDNTDATGIDLHLHAGPQEVGTQAQITYRDAKTGYVKYAYRYSTWFTETVTKIGTKGPTQLSFTSGDAPIVSYYSKSKKAVYSSTRISSTSYSAVKETTSGGLLTVSLNQRTGASVLSTTNKKNTALTSLELV